MRKDQLPINPLAGVAAMLFLAAPLAAQTYQVPLELRIGDPPGMSHGVEIVFDDATHGHTSIPGGGEMKVERLPAPAKGLTLLIPNGDPPAVAMLADQTARISLQRPIGLLKDSPYLIGYHAGGRSDADHEMIFWRPMYRAEGRLKLAGCEINLAVFDFNADGVFDRKDNAASTLAFDRALDGHFREFHFMGEIVDACGTPLEVAKLDPAGALITFRVSDRKPPSVGELVPSFSVPIAGGGSLQSAGMRGMVTLLDFWASWCGPCVAELDDVAALGREYSGRLQVYGIDVDEPERRAAGDRVIREKGGQFPQVIRAQGERDFLWKMFGSMTNANLSIPLFVVMDRDGRIQYAGHGGDQLADLRAILRRLLPARNF
jgi:thiol-disulfide isomerase/thioredoxin